MIRDEIITYEVAKLAREKGFNVPTFGYYRIDTEDWYRTDVYDDWNDSTIRCSAPTQSLLQRWLREEKNIHIEIVATACGYFWIADKTNGTAITDSDVLDRGTNEGGCFDTYELAMEDALKYALENLV